MDGFIFRLKFNKSRQQLLKDSAFDCNVGADLGWWVGEDSAGLVSSKRRRCKRL
jgi:hypothetical protein